MPKERQTKNEDAYRLWWWALTLNDEYREFCEWRRKNPRGGRGMIPRKFFIPKKDICPAYGLYCRFGDVFKNHFDDWAEDYFVDPFENIIREETKKNFKALRGDPLIHFQTTGLRRLQKADVEFCLKVYDLSRAGLTVHQTIEKVGRPADRDYDKPTIHRVYRRYRAKGERIVHNALWHCVFPDYE